MAAVYGTPGMNTSRFRSARWRRRLWLLLSPMIASAVMSLRAQVATHEALTGGSGVRYAAGREGGVHEPGRAALR